MKLSINPSCAQVSGSKIVVQPTKRNANHQPKIREFFLFLPGKASLRSRRRRSRLPGSSGPSFQGNSNRCRRRHRRRQSPCGVVLAAVVRLSHGKNHISFDIRLFLFRSFMTLMPFESVTVGLVVVVVAFVIEEAQLGWMDFGWGSCARTENGNARWIIGCRRVCVVFLKRTSL